MHTIDLNFDERLVVNRATASHDAVAVMEQDLGYSPRRTTEQD